MRPTERVILRVTKVSPRPRRFVVEENAVQPKSRGLAVVDRDQCARLADGVGAARMERGLLVWARRQPIYISDDPA